MARALYWAMAHPKRTRTFTIVLLACAVMSPLSFLGGCGEPAPEGRAAPHVEAMRAELAKLDAELRAADNRDAAHRNLDAKTLASARGRELARIAFDNYVAERTFHQDRRRVVAAKHRALVAEAVGKGPKGIAFLHDMDHSFALEAVRLQASIVNHGALAKAVGDLTQYFEGMNPPPTLQGDQLVFAEPAQLERYQALRNAVDEADRKARGGKT